MLVKFARNTGMEMPHNQQYRHIYEMYSSIYTKFRLILFNKF
jgi:hypothetical protein